MPVFDDIRVLDFGRGHAASMAAMHLADFGAEVIRIEGPGADHTGDGPERLVFQRNKTIVALDLETSSGLAEARKLIVGADIAVFDFTPKTIVRLGLDAPSLCALHPRLIHLWMPPFGTRGRYAELPPAHGLLAAITGCAFRQPSYNDQPVHLVTPQAFNGQAAMGAASSAAALYERRKSGAGQAIVVSGLHGMAQMNGANRIIGDPPLVGGRPFGSSLNYRLYQCFDGVWIFLGTLFESFFLRALPVLGLEGVDLAHITEPLMEEIFLTRPHDEWLRALKRAGVPCAHVGDRLTWMRGETVAANGMRVVLEHEDLGTVEMPGVSIKLSDTPGEVRRFAEKTTLAALPEAKRQPAPAVPDASLQVSPPLAGVKVLDFGVVIAGAAVGAILAHLGADVIKVESGEGDPFRSSGLMWGGYNRGKRGLGIDLKHPDGNSAFLDLARQADVVLDNFRLGVRERLGVDYASLAKVNPRIISCSITAYGPTGERAALPGFDPLMQSESGLMAAQGGDGKEPVFHAMPVNDVASAGMCVFGILAALHARERSGRGQNVVTSLASQSVLYQAGEMTWYEGRPPALEGDEDCIGASALERYYACADGWIAISAQDTARYCALLSALGREDLVARFLPDDAVKETRDGALAAELGAILSRLPRDRVLDDLLAANVPAVPALRGFEAFDDPFLAENGYFQNYLHTMFGPVTGVRGFSQWGRSATGFPRPSPGLGEHTEEILLEFGFSPERIEDLLEAGAVFSRDEILARMGVKEF